MKKLYCCDASRDLFDQYYARQQKGGESFPVHIGVYRQRGHGIGSVFASLFRRILPFIKSLGPQLLRSGAEVIDNVSKGKSWKQALKDVAVNKLPTSISEAAFGKNSQSGSGLRRKRMLKFGKKRSVKRAKRDIFS